MSQPPEEGFDAVDREAAIEPEPVDDDSALALVVVIDTSTLIEIKIRVPVGDQWELFDQMMTLVEEGRLAFPTRVAREMTRMRFPDAPGAWCGAAAKKVLFPDPDDATLVEILPAIAQLVEENAEPENEPADPYVVAMAYELIHGGEVAYDVAVATHDTVDRLPLKIAMTTACRALGITCWGVETFIDWVAATRLQED